MNNVSISRIVIFIIGLVLGITGLWLVVQHYNELQTLVVGFIMIFVGVVLLSGKLLTL